MKNILPIAKKMLSKKVLVIGDMMLDSYLKGTTTRIAREAPVPIVTLKEQDDAPGGAANTALNVAALGAKTRFISVGGQDIEAKVVMNFLNKHNVDTSCVFLDKDLRTIVKQRVMADQQLLVRYDYGSTSILSEALQNNILEAVERSYKECDGVIVSDYAYGVVFPNLLELLKILKKRSDKPIIVDSKHLTHYKEIGITAVKPNYGETTELLKIKPVEKNKRVDQILQNGAKILEVTGTNIACLTIDTDGAIIFEKGKKPFRTGTKPVENSKAAGAGDTYISALATSLIAGATTQQAAEIAAAAATLAVQKDGTSTCTMDEIQEYFTPQDKVNDNLKHLKAVCEAYREQGKKIIFTNGFFDLIHRGHIEYLSHAKEKGDILIVGVNSNESIQRVKGIRPVNSVEDRMQVLSALSTVDHVIAFDEDTAENLINSIKPDIYVKGGDYSKQTIIEAPLVEQLGGEVEIVPYVPHHIESGTKDHKSDVSISSLSL